MKKIVLVLFVVLISSVSSNAQRYAIDKGSMIIDGSVALTAGLSSGGGTSFEISPTVGFFVIPQLAAGGTFSLFSSSGYTSFAIIPRVNYYFGDAASKIYPYVSGGLGFQSISSGGSASTGIILLGGGAAFMLSRDVYIDGSAIINILTNSDFRGNTFRIMGGVGVFIW